MIIDYDNETYELPDHNLNHHDIRTLDKDLLEKPYEEILTVLLHDLDCTREFSCGRPMMTDYPMYARHINAYLYILDNTTIADTNYWIRLLIELHKGNIRFEEENPYTPPAPKQKKSKRKIAKYKTKDLITGEDAYLLEDTQTKRHVVRKNADALDRVKKNKSVVPMEYMTFNFKKKVKDE